MEQDPHNFKTFANTSDSVGPEPIKFRLTPKYSDPSADYSQADDTRSPYYGQIPSFSEIANSYLKVVNTLHSPKLRALLSESQIEPVSNLANKLSDLASKLDCLSVSEREQSPLKMDFSSLRIELESVFDNIHFGPQAWMAFQQMQEDALGGYQSASPSLAKGAATNIDPLKQLALNLCLLRSDRQAKQQSFLKSLDLIKLDSAKDAINQISALSSYFVNHPIDGFILSPDGNPNSMYADVARENLMSAEARIRELEDAYSLTVDMCDLLREMVEAIPNSGANFCRLDGPQVNGNRLEKAHRLSVKNVQRLLG